MKVKDRVVATQNIFGIPKGTIGEIKSVDFCRDSKYCYYVYFSKIYFTYNFWCSSKEIELLK